MLSQAIVQIVAQPPTLAIRHSCDLLVEPPPLSHLAFERGRAFVDTSIEFSNESS
jgi:hypothetical protein